MVIFIITDLVIFGNTVMVIYLIIFLVIIHLANLLMVFPVMDINQIRLYNLELALTYTERKELAEKLEYQTNYLNQFLSKKSPKPIGSAFARRFEEKFNLVHGWFDAKKSSYDFSVLFHKAASASKVDALTEKYDVQDFPSSDKTNIVPIEVTIESMKNNPECVELTKTILNKGIVANNAKLNTVAFVVNGSDLPRPFRNGSVVIANENELPTHGEEIIIQSDDGNWYVCEFLFRNESVFDLENLRTGKRMAILATKVKKYYHVIGVFPASQIIALTP